MDLPLHYHRHAWQAAEAAECAKAQGQYWRYHDLLLQNQDHLSPGDLKEYSSRLGLDQEKFQACLLAKAGTKAVQKDAAEAKRLGVTSAPILFVNGLYLKGPRKYAEFARLINQNYNTAEKIQVIETIWAIAYSDARLDKHEDYLVHKLAGLLRLTHRQLIDAKLRVKERTGNQEPERRP